MTPKTTHRITVDTVPTPALVVDVAVAQANIDQLAAYADFFGDGVLPARTTVQSGMHRILVEIDAVAREPAH